MEFIIIFETTQSALSEQHALFEHSFILKWSESLSHGRVYKVSLLVILLCLPLIQFSKNMILTLGMGYGVGKSANCRIIISDILDLTQTSSIQHPSCS